MIADGEEPEEEDENAVPDGEDAEAEVDHDEEERKMDESHHSKASNTQSKKGDTTPKSD